MCVMHGRISEKDAFFMDSRISELLLPAIHEMRYSRSHSFQQAQRRLSVSGRSEHLRVFEDFSRDSESNELSQSLSKKHFQSHENSFSM